MNIDILKAKVDKYRPFEGSMLEQTRKYYRVGLTYSSNALEGNSLTESETRIIIEDGLTVGGKPLRDIWEAVGHAKAYEYMYEILREDIEEEHVKTLHRLFCGIYEKDAGNYRRVPVFISGSKYPVTKPDNIEREMATLCEWIKERDKYHPVEFAALLHKKFVFIHPFIDGNGRIGRLLMNISLIQKGYLLCIIPPVLRNEYISLLEKAHVDDKPFVKFIERCLYESYKDFCRLLGEDIK